MPQLLQWGILVRLFGVLGTNLILSGDNAVVIAMAARRLGGSTRKRAIFWGASGAVALRMVFAVVITLLLAIPFLQATGGILLFWIACQLVQSEDENDEDKVRAGSGVWDAVKIIILADAVMSLDNVIALVGVSGGNLWLLGIGLVLTIPLVIWGAALLSNLIDRFPILVYAGAALLAWIAFGMIFEDEAVHGFIKNAIGDLELIVKIAGTALFILIVWFWSRRAGSKEAG